MRSRGELKRGVLFRKEEKRENFYESTTSFRPKNIFGLVYLCHLNPFPNSQPSALFLLVFRGQENIQFSPRLLLIPEPESGRTVSHLSLQLTPELCLPC